MAKPYADDLRVVAVRLIEGDHTRPEVAELCGIQPELQLAAICGAFAPPAASPRTSSVATRAMCWRSMLIGSSAGSPRNLT